MKAPKTIQPATINALIPRAASRFSPRSFHKPEAQQQEEQEENKTGLPDRLKAGIENLSGISLDGMKVHYNSSMPAQLRALAYAQGTEIHVAPGQERHLPHEAWHVVQQKRGRVAATWHLNGNALNDSASLEGEADVMGSKAIQFADNLPKIITQKKLQTMANNSLIIQRQKLDHKQLEGMASFLARRSGVSDPGLIRKDMQKWMKKVTSHTGESQSSQKDIRAAVPGGGTLNRMIRRHHDLTETGREAANEGAPIAEMRDKIHSQVPKNMIQGRAHSSELAAFAEIMNTDYSKVYRFTDGTATGNLSYRGKQTGQTTNLRPLAEEGLHGRRNAMEASKHMSGNTGGSPFVSTTSHVASALKTSDHELQNIMYGSPGRPGAPFIESFMVPQHGLLRADQVEKTLRKELTPVEFAMKHSQTMKLAQGEHEELFRNDMLDDYRVDNQRNPYRNWAGLGIDRIKSQNDDEDGDE